MSKEDWMYSVILFMENVTARVQSLEINVNSVLQKLLTSPYAQVYCTLFINKRFALNEMFQRNASKFAIFYV